MRSLLRVIGQSARQVAEKTSAGSWFCWQFPTKYLAGAQARVAEAELLSEMGDASQIFWGCMVISAIIFTKKTPDQNNYLGGKMVYSNPDFRDATLGLVWQNNAFLGPRCENALFLLKKTTDQINYP